MLLGILSLALPGITLGALVLLFGAYALIDGIMSLVGAWRAAQAHERWGVLILEGVAGIFAAVAALAWPAITALSLVYVIAAWAMVTGVLEVAAAVRLRRHISGEWLMALAGVASVIFGVALMVNPLIGALVLAIWVGVYALLFGAMLVGLGLRLRRRWLTGSTHAVSFP
jgi:uncharacterized membrane protein HdeD (DUF308 family)